MELSEIGLKVKNFYEMFQYPSTNMQYNSNFVELINMCDLFNALYDYDFNNKEILDAGTGSGDRIIEVARKYEKSKITAIDFCSNSIKKAKAKAHLQNIKNICFEEEDIMNLASWDKKYDVIFVMGVLHHLASPECGLKYLSNLLKEGGILFCYLYGLHGGKDRLRQKRIVEILSNKYPNDLEYKLKICKELQLVPKEYGWNYSSIDDESLNSLLADCFFNVNEKLYDYNGILSLMQGSMLFGFNIFGITTNNIGSIVNLNLDNQNYFSPMNFDSISNSQFLRNIYSGLSVDEKYQLMDMFYKPNGYTVVCWKSNTVHENESFKNLQDSYISLR